MKSYKIKKGKHSAFGLHFGFTFSKKVKFKCKFDKSCLYTFDDNDIYDINKLCGFSTTWYHHKQSGRVGWRCVDNKKFEILTYSYNDGVREGHETDVLGVVYPDQEFEVSIKDTEDFYVYSFKTVNQKEEVVINTKKDVKQKDWFFFHYLLYPYFGGNKTAPNDMVIYIKRLC